MLRADDIRNLRAVAVDYHETEKLKSWLRNLRGERNPLYLESKELEQIFEWKLGQQLGRNRHRLQMNPDDVYRKVTTAAFAVSHEDRGYEAEMRLGILTALRGVGVAVASAILALADPDRYCVIDFRGWRAIFNEDRRDFSIQNYLKYRREIQTLAAELGWSVQEVDLAVWEYDRRRNLRSPCR